MGIVIYLPAHTRSSARSWAKRIKRAALTPCDLATSVASKDSHHSAGILLRCHHFETRAAVAGDKSEAKASRDGHNSMTARKVVISDMTKLIGQSVLKRKAILSLDARNRIGHNVPMAEVESEDEYKQAFKERVAQARTARGWKQWQMAEALGIPQDKYKQYESRGLLPHRFIWRFCMFAHVNPEWLLTGYGKRAPAPLPEFEPDIVPEPRKAPRAPKRPGKRSVA